MHATHSNISLYLLSFQYGDAATGGTQGHFDIEPKTLASLVTELWTWSTGAPNVQAQEHCFNLDPKQVKNAQIIQVIQARTDVIL